MININEKELLNYAIENGILDLSYVQTQVNMRKRDEILKLHSYKKWLGSDGKWRTYVTDRSKQSGRRIVKRNTEKDLDDYLVNFYQEYKNEPTFKDYYWKWREVQDHLITDNSIYKYTTDYNRFFKDQDIENEEIKNITDDYLKVYFHDVIVKKDLPKSAFKHLYGYVNNTLLKAYKEKVIPENPMNSLTCKQFYKYCRVIEKEVEDCIIVKSDLDKILSCIHDHMVENPEYMPNYAVLLAYLTGMRVGEIVALEWNNIKFEKGYFLIDKSEKYDRITKEYTIEQTKNKKKRVFPLDEKLTSFFNKILIVQEECGYKSDYVFYGENGRIHAGMVSSCLKNRCKSAGVKQRGIHAFRKTLNSNLRCNGVSEVVASSLLGHSPQVNRDYYTFDVTSLLEKRDVISAVHTQ